MKEYILASAIVLIILAFFWKKSDLINSTVKIFLYLLGFAGLFYYAQLIGVIIKVIN